MGNTQGVWILYSTMWIFDILNGDAHTAADIHGIVNSTVRTILTLKWKSKNIFVSGNQKVIWRRVSASSPTGKEAMKLSNEIDQF